MVFEIIKNIKGRSYRYLVKGIREGKKVRHKFVKYLGPVSPANKRKKSTGRKPSVFVRELTAEEKQQLRQTKRSSNAFARDKAKIILSSAKGKTPKEIAEKLQMDYLSTLKTIRKFNKKGLGVLKRRTSNGRPRSISKEELNDLIETAVKSPRETGLPYSNWTSKLLSKWFLEKYKKGITPQWIRVLLRRNGVSYTVPKHKLMKADEKLRGAFKKS